MKLLTPHGEIRVINEPMHTFGSSDNIRSYPYTQNLSGLRRSVSAHGILLDEEPVMILGADGGATGIHENSALWLNECLYLAVSDTVFCIQPQNRKILWSIQVDYATCFGIYFHKDTGSLLSHGELQITRFTENGSILWQSGGRDIFTGSFILTSCCILAEDFNGQKYRFNYDNGKVM